MPQFSNLLQCCEVCQCLDVMVLVVDNLKIAHSISLQDIYSVNPTLVEHAKRFAKIPPRTVLPVSNDSINHYKLIDLKLQKMLQITLFKTTLEYSRKTQFIRTQVAGWTSNYYGTMPPLWKCVPPCPNYWTKSD